MVEQESLFIQLLVRVGSRVGCGCVKGLLVERCKLSQGERREDRAGVHKQLTCYVSGEERVLLLIHVGYEVLVALFFVLGIVAVFDGVGLVSEKVLLCYCYSEIEVLSLEVVPKGETQKRALIAKQ
ncbi:hypothetical protein K457DRAFT_153503 [Linnemannia elongata AG-77]|uniref:Uncharacterized protein n=1 Tax=Linnemannia elongata AG-77 TaxID=1314771 RepID=A0A197K696_9FUNG|nr:hypothetical protein K457DRAFT_153503 [Linnemannia elongata AG-77]